jgi:DNA polymerase III delta prime subunit
MSKNIHDKIRQPSQNIILENNININNENENENHEEEYLVQNIEHRYSNIEKKIIDMNQHITTTIKNMFKKNKFENMIIMGAKGSGKTVFINWFMQNYIRHNHKYLYLNYLDDKGIDMVRQKIKQFTELKYNSHKFIIIDDADDLSISAQQSLRRIMEQKKKSSTFIFTLRHFKNLIFPIHSRCILFELNGVIQFDTRTILQSKTLQNISPDSKKEIYKKLSHDDKYLYDTHRLLLKQTKHNNPITYIQNYNIKPSAWNVITSLSKK